MDTIDWMLVAFVVNVLLVLAGACLWELWGEACDWDGDRT